MQRLNRLGKVWVQHLLRVVWLTLVTEHQAEFLRSIHCNMAQGYLFDKPLPQEQFEEYSWYEPTIDADDWDGEEELSSVELANEKLLKAAIKAAK